MRKALQEMIRSRLTSVQRIEAAKDLIDEKNVLKAVLSDDIEKLQTTMEEIVQEDFDKTVNAIICAKRVYISAMRTSKFLAEFFGFYLNTMMDNVHVVCETGAAEVYEELIRIEPSDVFIGFTFPRYSSRAIKAMRYAKAHGATVIVPPYLGQKPSLLKVKIFYTYIIQKTSIFAI
jgi:DNA-binding MurR/RpiR family transcriptional regulator